VRCYVRPVHQNVVREQNLDHDIPALSVQLLQYDDGSIEFSGMSYRFRTADGDPYEYTVTVDAAHVPALRAAMGIAPDADVFSALVARTREIMKRGEHAWLTDRAVPVELFSWAPWVEIVDPPDPNL
jgi:hypothetical protein